MEFFGDERVLEKEEKTLIVIGVARGGTSLIAGVLHHLGIYMGKGSHPPVFEDLHLSNSFEHLLKGSSKKIINEYNNNHKVWGFKRPGSIGYIEKLHKLCRNPIYLVVFKDIFSISNRNNISMKMDIMNGLKKAQNDYNKILNFISKKDINGFLFSYEKVMQNKENFVETIATLKKDECTIIQKQKALEFIKLNPQEYLNSSRITKGEGRVEHISNRHIKGWAKYSYMGKTAEVELYVNGKLKATTIADEFCQHTLDNKLHPTGKCGFSFNLSSYPLKKGDKIALKIKEDIIYFKKKVINE